MRVLVAWLFVAAGCALAEFSYAQPAPKVARVGALGTAPSPAWESFRAGMRDLGWVEGRNLVIEWRFAKGQSSLHEVHAAEFVRMKLDAIVAPLSLQVEAARKATHSIPIVFCCHTDPVGSGHAQSVSRPGGNTTGVALFTADVTQKRLEILKQLLPDLVHVGVLNNPDYLEHGPEIAALKSAAAKLGMRLTTAGARRPEEFEPPTKP